MTNAMKPRAGAGAVENGMRGLLLALAAVACACALAACGNGGDNASTSASESQVSAPATLSESIDTEDTPANVRYVEGNVIYIDMGGKAGYGSNGRPPAADVNPDEMKDPGDAPRLRGGQGGNGLAPRAAEPDIPEGEGGVPKDALPKDTDERYNYQQREKAIEGATLLTIEDESIIFEGVGKNQKQGSLESIQAGSKLLLTVENGTTVTKIVVRGNMADGSTNAIVDGASARMIVESTSEDGEMYATSNEDENALQVQGGAQVRLSNIKVEKTGDSSSPEDSNFYGLNAGILAFDDSNLQIATGEIETDALAATGVHAFGERTRVTVGDVKVRTKQDCSGGVEVSGGAYLAARNLDVETQGTSSAAVRSDRGGGTMEIEGGSYKTHGTASPAVYSTAEIAVANASLESEKSDVVGIEGLNTLKLTDCDVVGNTAGEPTWSGVTTNVIIYRSFMDDIDGKAKFTMKGGSFKATNGTLFYVTNTKAKVTLEDVDIDSSCDTLMTVSGNNMWGDKSENGAKVTLVANNQKLAGNIDIDKMSSAKIRLKGTSTYEGALNADAAGKANVEMDDGSSWKLTGDSYVSSLKGSTVGIDLNGYKLYVAGNVWNG